MSRETVLFYCQHLLGVGHISRSLAICRALLDRFDVLFVQGGPDIGRTIDAPGFEHVFLPPILMREHDSSLYDPSGKHSMEELWALRGAALRPYLDRRFAAVVVELFPFGRNKFKPEVLTMIDAVRGVNPHAVIYSSNRDIMVRKPDQAHRERKIVTLLKEQFDYLIVHTDPSLIPLDETFFSTDQVRDQLYYTGYVADTRAAATPVRERKPEILVSLGGGAVGNELAVACARIAGRFPEHRMRILMGPYILDETREAVHRLTDGVSSVSVEGFSEDFRADLAGAQLSISLAGYNTLMDILMTRTPALVYPYLANIEQNMRARALEKRGLLEVLERETLEPDRLTEVIKARLAAPAAERGADIDMTGAETTARIIAEHVSERA